MANSTGLRVNHPFWTTRNHVMLGCHNNFYVAAFGKKARVDVLTLWRFPWGNELSDRDRGGDRGDRGGERGGDRERGGRDRDRERGLVCKLDGSHTKAGGCLGSVFFIVK